MKKYVSDGDLMAVTAAADTLSGAFVLQNYLAGFAVNDALSGAELLIKTKGVFDCVKATGAAWAIGELLYWNGTAFTKTVSTNTLIGVAAAAAVSGAAVGRIKLFEGFVPHA